MEEHANWSRAEGGGRGRQEGGLAGQLWHVARCTLSHKLCARNLDLQIIFDNFTGLQHWLFFICCTDLWHGHVSCPEHGITLANNNN